ncbi:ABC-2 family transporter protein [Clostridium ragsdalei P11]|uniref:ABC-2 family transporter protein n=1 Tax=Clostridium ragsdalei P11 TaxID=1353534 RepID=A0A1A6AIE1_9CLOT|nr:ABC transporter permease subunit [Clostridium ragsdalei]OBR89816.1 ABC-2 family transporter protein [Clostridium ragsdalei P11]
MLNYIKAELYKGLNRLSYKVTLLVLVLLSVSANALFTGPKVTALESMYMAMSCLPAVAFLVMMYIDVTEELKDKTLRNVMVSGLSREKLYISKVIIPIIISFITCTLVLIFFVGSTFLFLKPGNLSPAILINLSLRILCAIPLYIAAISFGVFLSFILKNQYAFAYTYAAIFALMGNFIKLLCALVSNKFYGIYNLLITTNISVLTPIKNPNLTSLQMLHSAGLGFAYTIIFTIIGIIIFKKMEIK